MGVAGAGKTTVAAELVRILGWPALEGDDLHPPANVAKMAAGTPLDDADRLPWLRAIAHWIGRREEAGDNAVVTCSALRRSYRDVLRDGHPSVWFAHLAAPQDVLARRMATRKGHYMPAGLLQSQLETLEPLAPDEPGRAFDAHRPATDVAADIASASGAVRARGGEREP